MKRKHPQAAEPATPKWTPPWLPFNPESLDFARGVEFGLAYARVLDRGCVEMAMHADMAEMVIRLAEHLGLPFTGIPHEHGEGCSASAGRSDCKDGGEWLDVTIGPAAG